MICAPNLQSSEGLIVCILGLTTGMMVGVSIIPWRVSSRPILPHISLWVISKIGGMMRYDGGRGYIRVRIKRIFLNNSFSYSSLSSFSLIITFSLSQWSLLASCYCFLANCYFNDSKC